MNTTTKETALLACIVESDFHSEPITDAEAWVNCVGDNYALRGFPRDGMGGVMNSLVNKGLVRTQGHGEDNVCAVTMEGLALYFDIACANAAYPCKEPRTV